MRVSLFVTCIVDQMFPEVGVATVTLLRRLGVEVTFNAGQTCCGQPAFNTGYREEARAVARPMLDLFEHELESADYIVAPSGSCSTMIKKFYRELFEEDAEQLGRIERIGARFFELSDFLVTVLAVEDVGATFPGKVTYHDSCHLLRELGVAKQPRALIGAVSGVELVEMNQTVTCCGFGGTFSVKYPEISTAIGAEKIASIEATGASAVVACDSSCLMQIAGVLSRRGSHIRCLHIAELLASENARTRE